MKKNTLTKTLLLFLLIFVYQISVVSAKQKQIQRQEVDLHIGSGTKIKAIIPSAGRLPPKFSKQDRGKIKSRKKKLSSHDSLRLESTSQQFDTAVFVNVIDSPPLDGFIPWIAVSVTDKRLSDAEFSSDQHSNVIGSYLSGSPESDFAIGIFDCGASAHVMGNTAATNAGIFSADLITTSEVEISGVTGSVSAHVSYPLGLFIDGLNSISQSGLNDSNMIGQSNVAIAVGKGDSSLPDLPVAIGSPMSIYYTTVINNDKKFTIEHNGEYFTAPDIRFYEHDDPCIPQYSNSIPLELRPLGAVSVQYIISLEFNEDLELFPGSPSVIVGNLSQSLFFVHSVDLYDGSNEAIDKDRFMLDTGAQVTVVGSRIAARLGLNPDANEFQVEIEGVTGDSIMAPGFYIDELQIPALGQWLSFTDIPVILLDIASPEGGTLDGIIGMNLFEGFNLVLKGGGIFLEDDPALEFEAITYNPIVDIAPGNGDGNVDLLDLAAIVDAWLATTLSGNWNPKCDMFTKQSLDGMVNFHDFTVFTQHWNE